MISVKNTGDFNKTNKFLKHVTTYKFLRILEKYGAAGVTALANATPVDTSLSANSWEYVISKTNTGYSIDWVNNNVTSNGVPVVILLQYGHATQNGGYVQGRDFINPTIQPIFDKLADEAWKELAKL